MQILGAGRGGACLLVVALVVACAFWAPESAYSKTLPFPVMTGELTVWPPAGSEIPTNGVILLEGSESYRDLVARVASNVLLAHEGRGVKLNVLEMHPGEAHDTLQVLLKPAVPLQANTEYTLHIALGAPTYHILRPRVRASDGSRVAAHWKSGAWTPAPSSERPETGPEIQGEILEAIACRGGDTENGFDLAARTQGVGEHSFVQMRIFRAGEATATAESRAVTECISRAWQAGNPTTSFRSCSVPPDLPPGQLRLELRPMDLRGQLGAPVTHLRQWRG